MKVTRSESTLQSDSEEIRPAMGDEENSDIEQQLKPEKSENMFMCPHCCRSFSRSDTLTRHLKTHHVEKFSTKASLEAHLRAHAENPSKCKYGAKTLINEHSLRKHIESNHKVERNANKKYQCSYCATVFSHIVFIQTHLKKDHPDKHPCTCKRCVNLFSYNSPQKHIDTQSEEVSYSCTRCAEKFSTNFCLHMHMKIHADVKRYSCPDCAERFHTKDSLQTHLEIHAESPFECIYCTKNFSNKSNLRKHVRRIHMDRKSHHCTEKFRTISNLRKHVKTIHSDESPRTLSNCAEKVSSEDSLETRLGICTGEQSYACTHCPEKFFTKDSLNVHLETHAKSLWKCAYCDESFSNHSNLGKHIKAIHTDESPFTLTNSVEESSSNDSLETNHGNDASDQSYSCADCLEKFLNKVSLQAHLKIHAKSPFECIYCAKNFSNKSNLRKHVRRIHKDQKSQTCTYCAEKFSSSSNLLEHMKTIHADENPLTLSNCVGKVSSNDRQKTQLEQYKCMYCVEIFSNYSNLRKHIKGAHTREKLYKCTHCSKCFSYQSFERHILSHTEKVRYNCTYCDEGFLTIYDLRQHLTIHTVEKKFTCTQCSRKFFTERMLHLHQRANTCAKPYTFVHSFQELSNNVSSRTHLGTHVGKKLIISSFAGKYCSALGA